MVFPWYTIFPGRLYCSVILVSSLAKLWWYQHHSKFISICLNWNMWIKMISHCILHIDILKWDLSNVPSVSFILLPSLMRVFHCAMACGTLCNNRWHMLPLGGLQIVTPEVTHSATVIYNVDTTILLWYICHGNNVCGLMVLQMYWNIIVEV